MNPEQLAKLRQLEERFLEERNDAAREAFMIGLLAAGPQLMENAEVVAACERWKLRVGWVEDGGHAGWLVTDTGTECDISIMPTFVEAVFAAAKWLEQQESK